MAMARSAILVVLGAVLCAVGLGVALRPWQTAGTSIGNQGSGANQKLTWRRVEVNVGDKKGIFEAAKFDPPVPFKAIPVDQTKRDTPLNTWVSFKSHGVAGKNEEWRTRMEVIESCEFAAVVLSVPFLQDRVHLGRRHAEEMLHQKVCLGNHHW